MQQTCKNVVETWTERVRHEVYEFFNVVHEVCEWLPWPSVGSGSFVVDEIGGLPEGVAGLLGWLPKKNLDLHVFVLRDRQGSLVLESEIGQVLKETERTYWVRARVAVKTTVHMLESVAPDAAFDIDRDGPMFGEDLTAAGSYFQATAALELGDSAAGLVSRRPAPICAFIIDNVSGSSGGCSLGPHADWIVIEKDRMKPSSKDGKLFNTLAHEMAHACGLRHTADQTNLLYPSEINRGDDLSPFQRMIVRNSPHVAFRGDGAGRRRRRLPELTARLARPSRMAEPRTR